MSELVGKGTKRTESLAKERAALKPPSPDEVVWMAPLGLILESSRGPLDPTYLPLDDSMTVLYGLNGSGKSFVLDALRGSFSGTGSERLRDTTTYLLAEAPTDLDRWPNGLVRAFESVTGKELLTPFGWHEHLEEQLTVAWDRMWLNGYHDEFDRKDELAKEFASSGMFLVRPVGVEIPTWELRPAIIPARHTPASHAFLQRIRNLDDADAVTFAPVYQLWEEQLQPPGAPTVLYSESYSVIVSSSSRAPVRLWDDVISESDSEDVDYVTAATIQRHLEQQHGVQVLNQLAESLQVEQQDVHEVTQDSLVEDIQARANSYYATLLRDAPALELAVRPQREWLTETAMRWVARRLPTDRPVPVSWLSHAERRWAALAIKLSLSGSSRPMILLDEPEAALHRTAEAHMATALGSLAAHSGASILASTHSPELLDSQRVKRVLVKRRTSEQPGELIEFTGAALEAMEDLGLQPSDLLSRTRGFLLVEGEHDVAVLKGWFASDLKEMGVDILPLRGGSRLRSVLDSRFLFDYTDALLFPFLDDIDSKRVQSLWTQATRSLKTSPTSEVIDTLTQELRRMPSKGTEYVGAFLTRALQLGRESRVFPLGVRRTDILDYLPVADLVPGASSWQSLRAELKAAKQGVEPSETEFKDWLTRRYKVWLTPEALAAVAAHSSPAAEIAELIDQVRSAVTSPNNGIAGTRL